METQNNYRSILRAELEARIMRNPRYSMRSFARDIGITPSRLSDVLRERYGLSRAAATNISERLGFQEQETKTFCDLVDSLHARNRKIRESAKERISHLQNQYHQIQGDLYKVVSDWYHFAILELTGIDGFKNDVEWISQQLGIMPHVVVSAIQRLKSVNLLVEDSEGNLKAATTFSASPDGIPNRAIKESHRQVLEKAIYAIDFQNVEERDLSSMILAIDSDQIPEAKKLIKKFRREFDARFGNPSKKKKVYCLAVQFFDLHVNKVKENQ